MKIQEWIKGAFMRNRLLKVVAFLLAIWLAVWVREDRETTIAAFAPVRMILPENMVLVSPSVDRVRITVRGRWSELNRFDPSQMEPITIPVSPEDHDEPIPITSDLLQLPRGVRVVAIQPDFIRVSLEELVSRRVSIVPSVTGRAADGFEAGVAAIRPSTVEIRGPSSAVEGVGEISTEPVDIGGARTTLRRTVRLRLPAPDLRYDEDTEITVTVPIEAATEERRFEGIPVVARNAEQPFRIRPETVSVTVRGPRRIVDGIGPDTLYAVVNMERESGRSSGQFEKDVSVENLPAGLDNAEVYPARLLVTIVEEE